MLQVSKEQLAKVSYLDLSALGDRTVKLMPLWDGSEWHMWVNSPVGLIEAKIVDTSEGDYVAQTAATPSDLYIPFVHIMWQQASWKEVCPLVMAISDDFHNIGTSVAKLKHFHRFRREIVSGGARRFASTELEYLVTLLRSVFDLLQEMFSIIWKDKVRLTDPHAEEIRRRRTLPRRFSSMVLVEKNNPRTANDIEAEFGLPSPLASQFANAAPFFAYLRRIRDKVVHGQSGFGFIFETDRGFCVDPKIEPFRSFAGWRPEHRFNENIVSILPWLADIIARTIGMCNDLVTTFASVVHLPPPIAPKHVIFVRGPHNPALAELLSLSATTSPWWDDSTGDSGPKKDVNPDHSVP